MEKAWTDVKSDVKKKLQLKRQNLNMSGAGPINITITELDERVISICGKQLLDGDEGIPEIGFNTLNSMTDKQNIIGVVNNDHALAECDSFGCQ